MIDSRLNRREFMRLLVTATAVYPLSILAENRKQVLIKPLAKKEPWLTISAVQEHLFPAEETSPGASDIHALHYLQAMMQSPDFDLEEKKLISDGVGWLNDLAIQQYKIKFIKLDLIKKEKILRRIENSRVGSNWLSVLLSNIIEALLSDPVYAGNPNSIGWKWLNHQPGFPLPTKDKRYYKLHNATRRNIKA